MTGREEPPLFTFNYESDTLFAESRCYTRI
jgi:hypothetical protein